MTAVRNDWQERRLGEIADFRNGVNYTKENFGRGVKVINVKDFQDYTIPRYDALDEINPDGAVRSAHLLEENDVIFVRSNGNRELIGRSLALLAVPPEPITHSAFTIRVRLHRRPELNPRFYAYVFRSDVIRQVLSAQGNGANISNLNQNILERLIVPLPPRPQQDRIVAILSAYDDLIENNTRRIAVLEEMARRLYEEWLLPQSAEGAWNEVPFSMTLADHIGGGWGKDEADVGHPEPAFVIRGTDIPAARAMDVRKCPLRFHAVSNLKSRRLVDGDLIMEVSGGSKDQLVGRPLLVSRRLLGRFDDAVMCASFCKRLQVARDVVSPLLLYHFLSQAYVNGTMAQFQVQSTGITNFQFQPFLEKVMMPIPPIDLQSRFQSLVGPLRDQIEVLGETNANLRAQRDKLLPKLIWGEIDVTGAEGLLEAAE